jgi:DNA-binding NarL/FixJ family response regulator
MNSKRRTQRKGPTRIAIADGNTLSCTLLKSELSKNQQFCVVGSASTSEQLLAMFTPVPPDIVLTGSSLADGPFSGLNAIRQLHAQHRDTTRFILLVDQIEQDVVLGAIQAGARGIFCLSSSHLRFLRKCIFCVQLGQVWLNTEMLNYLLKAFTIATPLPLAKPVGKALLTPRENAVARLVAEAASNRDIATQLNLSESTVKNHLFHIFDKLGIHNRFELGLYISTHGFNIGPEQMDLRKEVRSEAQTSVILTA